MVAHASLPNADLHECKGASTATAGKTIVANGTTATFKYANPHGAVYYSDVGVGTTITYPSVATKIAPTTVASGTNVEYTESTTARLTYTGADTMDTRIIANINFSQSVGANRDILFTLYKNGSAILGSVGMITATSAIKNHYSLVYDVANVATNDYFEIYVTNTGASGDVLILSFYMTAFGMRG